MKTGIPDPQKVIGIANRLRIAPDNERQKVIDELLAAIDESPSMPVDEIIRQVRSDLSGMSPAARAVTCRLLRNLRGHSALFEQATDFKPLVGESA